MSYLTLFRTHVWDDTVAAAADRARTLAGSGEFVIAADESKGKLPVAGFQVFGHTEDFSALGLPGVPVGRVMWWNSDYVLYAARAAFPQFDYYLLLEFDVLLNCAVQEVVNAAGAIGADLVAHDLRRIGPDSIWYSTISGFSENPLWAFLPFLLVSGRAVDAMLRLRKDLARQHAGGMVNDWPYCETFVPTAIVQKSNMRFAPLGDFVDVGSLRYRPFLSVRDPGLSVPNSVAHPLLGGVRFIQAIVANIPAAALFQADGCLAQELQREDPTDLQNEFDALIRERNRPEGPMFFLAPAEKRSRRDPNTMLADLAHRRPAEQSSVSPWSRARSVTADAGGAVCGYLVPDYAFHTAAGPDPWWQVDLGPDALVEEVEIVNRMIVPYKFCRFSIVASSDGNSWTSAFTKTDNSLVSADPADPAVIAFREPLQTRFVRIIQHGNDVMHLRRVRVFGTRRDGTGAAPSAIGPRVWLDAVLADDAARDLFDGQVASAVHTGIFGRTFDSYNIDSIAYFAAAVDASQYAVQHMPRAPRFRDRFDLLSHAARMAPAEGLVLEFGVYTGQTINHLARLLPDRRIYGFDSFEGLPETWRPGFAAGALRRPEPPAVSHNVELVAGWFDRTLPGFLSGQGEEHVALLHVDCDLYSSTQTIFAQLGKRIAAGTIIVFDEYFNYPGWRVHEFRAFQEFVGARHIHYDYVGVVPGNQQVAVRIVGVP